MPIPKSVFTSAWTLRSAEAWGSQVAALAGYEAGQPTITRQQHTRLGGNANSVTSQIERVRMEFNAEWLAKNSAFGIGYIRQRKNYCSPLGWMPGTSDSVLNGEIRAYFDEWMEDGGMNCSAYDSFDGVANVDLPVRGDSALVWKRDETRLRLMRAGGDQIGELNVYGNPSYISRLGLTYFCGMYFDGENKRQAFRIYDKGTQDYFYNPHDYPASDVIYFQDNLFAGTRGVTIFHGTIKTLTKSDTLFDFGMDSAQKQAKTGVVVRNEQGGPLNELSYTSQTTPDGNVIYIERTFEGSQTEYQYNGDAYEIIKTESPGPELIEGCRYADEKSCLSLGMPFSFLVNARDVGGAPSRLEISKAGKEVERLRRVQAAQFKRVAYVVIMDAVDRGIFKGAAIQRFSAKQLTSGVPKFTNLPTADAFRESQMDIADNRAGNMTREEIAAKDNRNWTTDILPANKREAMEIEMATQDANRELAKTLSPVDFQPYKPNITVADIAQNSDNPQQSASGEAISQNGIAPMIPSSGKGQVTDNPPNVTRGVFSEFDELKHPRAENGEFGVGSDGKPKAVSAMNTHELKMHKLNKKIEAGRAKTAEIKAQAEAAQARVADLRTAHDKLKEELAKPNPNIDAIKNRVKETEEKLRATELRTSTINHALRTEDIAADEHGQDSPEHQSAQRRTQYAARMSAYIGDIRASDLPESTQNDIANILGTNGTTGKLKLIKYGMVPSELEKMADAHNLESAQRHIKNMPNYACSDDVHGDSEKHVLIQNNKVIDGHHYLAKALKGGVTKSLPVIDLSPARFQANLSEWDESKHPRAKDGEFGAGGGQSAHPVKKKSEPVAASTKRTPAPTCDDRCQRAKAAHVMVDKTIQRYAEEHNEPKVAKALGGVSFPDGEPIDIAVAGENGVVKHGVELKTVVKNSNGKITMKGDAIARKAKWERKNKAKIHTVVIDDSDVFNAKGDGKHDESKRKIYYANGYGSFRISSMHQAKDMDEVKALMNTPYAKLPAAAQKR